MRTNSIQSSVRCGLLLVAAMECMSQSRVNSMSGRVQLPDGSNFGGGARVIAMRLPDSEKDEVFQTGFALSGKDGTYRIDGLAAGRYEVCVSAMNGEFVDECDWGKAAVVAVATGQESLANLRLAKGVLTWVDLEDNGKLLEQHEGKSAGGVLHLGVVTQRGDSLPMRPGQVVDGKKSYWVVVPPGTKFRLEASSALFDIDSAEESGESLTALQAQREFGDSETTKKFKLKIKGLKTVEAKK